MASKVTKKTTFSQVAKGKVEKVENVVENVKVEEKVVEKVAEKVAEKLTEKVAEKLTEKVSGKEEANGTTLESATLREIIEDLLEKWAQITQQARNGSAFGRHMVERLGNNLIPCIEEIHDMFKKSKHESFSEFYSKERFGIFNKRITEQTRNMLLSDAQFKILVGVMYDKLCSLEKSLNKTQTNDVEFKESLKIFRDIINYFYTEEYVGYVMKVSKEAAEKHSLQKEGRIQRQLQRQKEREQDD